MVDILHVLDLELLLTIEGGCLSAHCRCCSFCRRVCVWVCFEHGAERWVLSAGCVYADKPTYTMTMLHVIRDHRGSVSGRVVFCQMFQQPRATVAPPTGPTGSTGPTGPTRVTGFIVHDDSVVL